MVQTQTEAKRFFVDRVVAEARRENITLSDAEQKMLFWSESDPDVDVDLELPQRLAAEISDDDYERKIVGLLSRGLEAERELAPEAEAQWRQAAAILHQGDHYIVIMVDQAIGPRSRRWWEFWK